MTVLVPSSVNVLHVAVEAAKLGKEFSFIQVTLAVFNIGFDAWTLIKSPIRVILRVLDSLTKHVIILDPSC